MKQAKNDNNSTYSKTHKKTGNTYDTTVVMTVDENQRAVFELNFEKGEAKYGKGKGKKN